jgi:hypothetical protein
MTIDPTPFVAAHPSRPSWRRSPLGVRLRATELLDGEGHDPAELADNLDDIGKVNRLGGGTRVVLRHLPTLLDGLPWDRPVEILDLGTGSADIPVAVADWLRPRNRPARIVASDVSDDVLVAARRRIGRRHEISVARYDALAVPLPDRSVDVVLSSLTMHHFEPEEAVRLLGEMHRLARVGFILNDIARSAPGFAAAWVSSRLGTRNRMTRHDMPLSVRRAYAPSELEGLLASARVEGARVTTHPLFRMAAVWTRPASGQAERSG